MILVEHMHNDLKTKNLYVKPLNLWKLKDAYLSQRGLCFLLKLHFPL